ncbi:hypothetical protein [Kaarinaea lacus]
MKLYLLTISTLFFVLTACASAEPADPELKKQVYDRVSEEFATCSAYYSIVSAAMKKTEKQKMADEADDAMEKSFGVALDLAMQNNTEGEANRLTWSRYQSSLEIMEKEAGKDYGNISTVRSKYGERCQWIMTYPEELMKEKTREMQNNKSASK